MRTANLIKVLALLAILSAVAVDRSVCLSCSFEVPLTASDSEGGPGEDCSLCSTLLQPLFSEPLLADLAVKEFRPPSDPGLSDGPPASVFHPPRPLPLFA